MDDAKDNQNNENIKDNKNQIQDGKDDTTKVDLMILQQQQNESLLPNQNSKELHNSGNNNRRYSPLDASIEFKLNEKDIITLCKYCVQYPDFVNETNATDGSVVKVARKK